MTAQVGAFSPHWKTAPSDGRLLAGDATVDRVVGSRPPPAEVPLLPPIRRLLSAAAQVMPPVAFLSQPAVVLDGGASSDAVSVPSGWKDGGVHPAIDDIE